MFELIKNYIFKIKHTNVNNKNIINNTIGAFIVKGGALIVSLLTMPSFIRYFNNQQILGLWFTMLSVLSWILTFDLGIGNGLRNHLVPVFAKKDYPQAKKYISSAYVSIGILILLTTSIALVVFQVINWNFIFHISENIISNDTLKIAVCIVFSGIMLQFLLKLITSILYALQKSAVVNFISLISSIITLLYVSFAKSSSIAYNLIVLAFVQVLAINVPLIITTIYIFKKYLKECKPNIRYYNKKFTVDIMKLGGVFFWIQIMYMIISTTNEFLITWLTGNEMVVEYQIYNKLFTLIGTVFILALTPIWSAVTKSYAEGNIQWIKSLYRNLNRMAMLAVLAEFIIILFLQIGIDIWLGNNSIKVNYIYAVIFAISGSIFIWNGVLSSIANGIGELRTQSIFFTIGAFIKIPLAWLFVNLTGSWIGIIIANIAALLPYCLIQPTKLNTIFFSKIRR